MNLRRLALLTSLITVAAATPAAAGDGRFGKGAKLPLIYPATVAVADFDGDGRMDLASLNYVERYVSIQLAQAGGGFKEAPHVGVGSNPTVVVAADFNGDANPDLAVANYDDFSLSIRLGNGDGTFTDAPDVTLPRAPAAVAVGDLNSDAREDLVVAERSTVTPRVSVWHGAGDGKFAIGPTVDVDAAFLAVGDFNADTREDVAVGGYGSEKSRLLIQSGSKLEKSQADLALPGAADRQRGMAVGDFDADGNLDLAAAVPTKDVVSVRLGNSAGGFSAAADIAIGDEPTGVAVGDFNSDGHQDVVAIVPGEDALKPALGDGKGGFKLAAAVPTGDVGNDVVVGDFDADGVDDLASASFASNGGVFVHRGLGRPALAGNLLRNGGFERPPQQGDPVPAWKLGGIVAAVAYGRASHAYFPSPLEAPLYGGGSRFLWGGESSATNGITTATQTVDVAGRAGVIDAGKATANLSAYLGGALAFFDEMDAKAQFVGAGGAVLGSFKIGPVSAFARHAVTMMQRRAGSAKLPKGTRRIRVTLTSTDHDKSYSSAVADNVKLTIDAPPTFGPKTRVGLSLAAKRIATGDPLRVRVGNQNAFAVAGTLRARSVARLGQPPKPVRLTAAPLQLAPDTSQVVKLALPKRLRDRLEATGKLGVKLTALVRDPAGVTRRVRKTVQVQPSA